MTTITNQVINDGDRNVVIKSHILGTAVELTDGVLVDVSALVPAPTTVKVLRVQAETVGMSLTLEWEATTDVPFLEVPMDEDVDHDYREHGGLPNDAGAGITGDILVTTIGAAVGTNASIVIHCKKT